MGFGLVRTAVPVSSALLLADAREHVRSDGSDDDYLQTLVDAAAGLAEERLGRALVTQTWRLSLDAFPLGVCGAIELPRPPLQEVKSITYVGTNGDAQTVDPSLYVVDTDAEPGRVVPKPGAWWPCPQAIPGVVKVTYTAGYGDGPDDVPRAIRQGMLLLIGHWYANRESVVTGTIATEVPMGVDALWAPYRVWWA